MRKHNAHLLVHCCLYRPLVDIKSVLCISKTKLEQLNTNHVTSPYSTENVKQNCRCRFKYHNEILCVDRVAFCITINSHQQNFMFRTKTIYYC